MEPSDRTEHVGGDHHVPKLPIAVWLYLSITLTGLLRISDEMRPPYGTWKLHLGVGVLFATAISLWVWWEWYQ